MRIHPGTLLIGILTRLRDSRLVWDLFGTLYNRRVAGPLTPLYERIGEEVRLLAPLSIMDVGCGPGYFTRRMATLCPEAFVCGIDYSAGQIRFARRSSAQQEHNGQVTFFQGDAMALAFRDAVFDVVVSIGSIKHWPNPRRGVEEIRRVLRPGGVLILSETDREATDEAIQNFMVRFGLPVVPASTMFWGLKNVVFGRSFSQVELAALLRKTGFAEAVPLAATVCPYTTLKAW
ncbi:MAG: class I SAM-dependent methyltransferase [Syntrophales bacterium]|nr:class I SAM-dependent methyltransferase [Syntrophales bacterium]